MTNPSQSQSQKRFNESLSSLFTNQAGEKSLVFIKSSSDEGVQRNGGRNGARFAPQSLLATFKKLSQTPTNKSYQICEYETASAAEEKTDFHSAQDLQSERIKKILASHQDGVICHIGGGHDHIYPLLKAASEDHQKVVVLNIDAHADTRTDDTFHSGTPFRQFAKNFAGEFVLFQYGLHPFANSFSTLEPMPAGEMKVLWKNELTHPQKKAAFLASLREAVDQKTLVIFSLDADALKASDVPGVSAVNSDGVSLDELKEIWREFSHLSHQRAPIVGIYELNPLYDTLSGISMRTISNFLFEVLK